MWEVRKVRLRGMEEEGGFGQEVEAQRKLVAVIDDSLMMRKLLEVCLGRAGFGVVTFGDGVEAMRWLALLEAQVPDLVLLDVCLPKVDGFEVARRLKAVPRFREMVVVMLSRRDGMLDRLKGRLVGARGYLTKPVKTQDIVAAVAGYLMQCPQVLNSPLTDCWPCGPCMPISIARGDVGGRNGSGDGVGGLVLGAEWREDR